MRLIPLNSLTSEDLDSWRQLSAEAVEPNPFFEPQFVSPSAAALGVEDVQLLVDDEGGSWRGCIPTRLIGALGRPLLLASWKHPYSFLGTPLVAPAAVEDFADALARSMSKRTPSRMVMLRRASEGPVLDAIRAAVDSQGLNVVFERSMERAALLRRSEPNAYLAEMKPKRRSELRRLRRKLGEKLGEELVDRTRQDIAVVTEEFLRLEAAGWKGEQGTAMASQQASADLFRRVCAEFDGRLSFRSLEAGDRVLALTCSIAAGDALFGFKTTYDEELRRYSPGIQLQIDDFMAFHEDHSKRMIDSCGEPGNEAMSSLWPDRRRIATTVFGPSGPLGWAFSRVLERSFAWKNRDDNPAAAEE